MDMSQELEHKVRELEEITDISEPVIDITEEDIIIDMPAEEKVSGELEEITGLQDITTSTLIIEDENPPLQIQKGGDDDIINITAHVDAKNTITVVRHTAAHERLQKEDRLFEDIPEPLHSSATPKEESHVKDSYIDTAIDVENREIKGKIYYDKNIDALVIEDFSKDEEVAQEEQEESKEVASGHESEEKKAIGKVSRVDEDNLIKDESKIDGQEADIITIEIPPEVRNKIEEKDIEDFQFINLDEAEQIAREDILILSEEDLIEELDEYDLIPIETNVEEKKSKEKKKEKVISEVKVSPKKHEPEKKEIVTDVQPQDVELSEEAITKPDKEKKIVEPVKPIKEELIQKEQSIDLMQEEIPVTQDIITEAPEIDKEIKEKPQDKPQPPSHEKNIDIITLEEEFMPAPQTTNGTGDSFDTKNLKKDYAQFNIETIPDDLVVAANQKIMIIDDAGVEVKEHLPVEENPIDDIDKLVSGIIEITEGDAKILKEASSKEEDEYIAPILTGTLPTFQDRMIEFEEEYKFKDDDIVFIDNAVLVDEYDKYLKVIDDYYATKTVKKSSSTVELFGLTKDEFEFFYDILFEKEYETIKASKAFKDITVGRDHPEKDATLVKQFKYIQAKPQSLSDKEKKSIEENIESPVAIVIEENIDDIVERLKKVKPQVDIKKLLAQMTHEPSMLYDVDDSKPNAVIEEKPAQQEEITNITDQVIILDSKEDVNRFVDTLPVEKQANIRKLLKYLDSLFDKLPEDVIKNFANSEYFDLYVKVLHELGV